jgi:hypothetical protein
MVIIRRLEAARRATYVHQARIIYEIAHMLQLASDGHSTFRNDQDLLEHIRALAWSSDGLSV